MHGPFIQSGVFTDTDRWSAEVRDWNLHFSQIEAGPLEAALARVMLPATILQKVKLNRRFHQEGHAPDGVFTFGIPDDHRRMSWYGDEAHENSVMNFNSPDGFDAVSVAGFSATTLSMPSSVFLAEAAALGHEMREEDLAHNAQQHLADPLELQRLKSISEGILACLSRNPPIVSGLRELEADLRYLLVSIVTDQDRTLQTETRAQRQKAVDRAVEIIASNESLTIAEVCRYAAISQRSLDRAFKERFGISPKRYMIARRLGAARRSIQNAPPDARIADIACDHGFWHLGRFASDYKLMFGELPSETLQAANG